MSNPPPSNLQASKEKAFELVAQVAASFGSSARLKILQILSQAPRSVEGISNVTGETVANTSQHLRRLLKEGLVEVTKNGLSRIYRIKNWQVASVLEELFDLATAISPNLVSTAAPLAPEDLCSPHSLHEIFWEIQKGKAVLIDVREQQESEHSPIPHAINIPLAQLRTKAKGLAKSKIYYLLCRGRLCGMANEGVQALRSSGYKAFRLRESPIRITEVALKTKEKGEKA